MASIVDDDEEAAAALPKNCRHGMLPLINEIGRVAGVEIAANILLLAALLIVVMLLVVA